MEEGELIYVRNGCKGVQLLYGCRLPLHLLGMRERAEEPPPGQFSDDVVVAVEGAAAVAATLKSLNAEGGVAVVAGEALCTLLGVPWRCEVNVDGPAAQRARALANKSLSAGGRVLCDSTVKEASRRSVVVEPFSTEYVSTRVCQGVCNGGDGGGHCRCKVFLWGLHPPMVLTSRV